MRHTVVLTAAALWLAACDTTPAPTSPVVPKGLLPELAATSIWMPLDVIFPNECPPVEDVAFSGKAHFVFEESGGGSRLFINWAAVEGVGLVSGDRYVIRDNYQEELIPSGDGTLEIREHFRMLRQGSPDNVLATVHLIFNLTTGDVQELEFEIVCRG